MATLLEWLESRWLVPHKTSNDELAGLRAIVDRELHDASVEQISLDARLGMLFNAALKLAEIALRVNGYRAARERQHERTIGSLVMTLGEKWEPAMRLVDQIRVLRNRGDYESVGVATQAEVRDLSAEVELMLPAVRKVARDKGFKIS
jgi:hypothetical protein